MLDDLNFYFVDWLGTEWSRAEIKRLDENENGLFEIEQITGDESETIEIEYIDFGSNKIAKHYLGSKVFLFRFGGIDDPNAFLRLIFARKILKEMGRKVFAIHFANSDDDSFHLMTQDIRGGWSGERKIRRKEVAAEEARLEKLKRPEKGRPKREG